MPERETPKLTLLEERKLQAAVLVPVMRAFRAELGEDRANAIARQALYGWLVEESQRIVQSSSEPGEPPLRRFMAATAAWGEVYAPETAAEIDYEPIRHDEAVWQFNVRGCRYAQFFRELGEPELGSMLLCSADNALTEAIGDGLELVRSQTMMRGADHCDFKWHVPEAPAE